MKIQVNYLLEISNHWSYCSGDECEYTAEEYETEFDIDHELYNILFEKSVESEGHRSKSLDSTTQIAKYRTNPEFEYECDTDDSDDSDDDNVSVNQFDPR